MNIFQPIFDVRDRRGGISSLPIANEPIFDVAHLAHVELLTSGPKGTLWYFKDLLGMRSPVRAAQEQLVPAEAGTDLSSGVRPARGAS